jgi:hypothetical protein
MATPEDYKRAQAVALRLRELRGNREAANLLDALTRLLGIDPATDPVAAEELIAVTRRAEELLGER